jgi:hypothetical protein
MISDQVVREAQRFCGEDSLAWKALEKYLTAMIQDRREALDNPKMDSTETAVVRGEIRALKELLALPKQVTQVVQSDPGYGTTSATGWET